MAKTTEKSHLLRPNEHDSCINNVNLNSLKKLHNHHREMASISDDAHGTKRHTKLADAYKEIIDSVHNRSPIR